MNKSQLTAAIAEHTNLAKKDVNNVIAALGQAVQHDLKKHGTATVPGIAKLVVKTKPAQRGGQIKINPFTKEEYTTTKKPAKKVVKARPLKAMKDAV